MTDGRSGSPHFRVSRIAPGVWAAIARDGGYGLCNAGIVDLGGTTVVFDSMLTPTAGMALRLAARRCTGRAPDVVVNSHWHGDHIRGNSGLAPAVVVSTRKTRDLIRTKGVDQWNSDLREMPRALAGLDAPESTTPVLERAMYRGWFEGTLRVPRSFRPTPPNVTFDRELTLAGTRQELEVRTFGGGHSPSDVFAFLPERGIVFLGDLVSVGLHPSTGDGVPARWRSILRRIVGLGVSEALPGHGPVGSADDIRRMERYLFDLDRLARAALRRGDSEVELRRSPVPTEYRSWRFSAFFLENLIHSFRLAGGRATSPG
ncbi:MAG: MBL fold metallo-hydrolase [Thermoplasmata archaeon]|nr:MBL fold metallo-hydrolase [Thermoplasmata archaeon]